MKKHFVNQGFTLIEVMVTLVVIGIIAGFAIPSYTSSMEKARRVDAQAALVRFAAALERYYTVKSTYLGADNGADAKGGIPDPAVFANETPIEGSVKYYDLRMSLSASAYTLYAIPKGSQQVNGKLKLTSTNERKWDIKNDGSYSSSWQ